MVDFTSSTLQAPTRRARGHALSALSMGDRKVPEYPRVPESASGDHHAITSRLLYNPRRRLLREDIAARDDRNVYRLFHRPYHRRIRPAPVSLVPGPSVDADRGRPCRRNALRDLRRIDRIMVPSGAYFYRHRDGRVVHQGAYEPEQPLGLPQQRSPFPLSGHFMDGTGGVQVNHVVRVVGKGFEGLKEHVRLTAEQLDAKGPIQGRGPEEIEGLAVLETQGPGIYHLRKREGAAKRPRNKPKGQVAYPGHRGQHKRHREVKAAKGKHASFYRENPASVK